MVLPMPNGHNMVLTFFYFADCVVGNLSSTSERYLCNKTIKLNQCLLISFMFTSILTGVRQTYLRFQYVQNSLYERKNWGRSENSKRTIRFGPSTYFFFFFFFFAAKLP